MSIADTEIAANNKKFMSTYDSAIGEKGRIYMAPKRGIAIICCMDPRLEPFAMTGLEIGDAHIIRNGGGRAIDAMRSLIGSEHFMNSREIVVIHHEDCGFQHATTEALHAKMKETIAPEFWPFIQASPALELGPDPTKSVKLDVEFLRHHPLVHKDAKKNISGWYYKVSNGELVRIC
ncbi:hypothetical protein JCM1840_002181 [Sporobolomyces johnsonii]